MAESGGGVLEGAAPAASTPPHQLGVWGTLYMKYGMVRLAVRNFTSIGARRWVRTRVAAPKVENFHFLATSEAKTIPTQLKGTFQGRKV